MPNSAETAVASLSFSALDPTVGPSMALGRCAALAAIVNRERAYARVVGLSPKPVSRRKSPMPNASRNVPLVAAISVIRSSPRAVSTSATIGTFGSRLAVSVTWSTDSTIASITPPTDVLAEASRGRRPTTACRTR